jgi:uncharacterized protein YlxW (UPF0749 family)
MQITKTLCLLGTLLLFFGSLTTVNASVNSNISFQSVGVTINLVFPSEVHPTDNISHNLTITANSALTIQNFTIAVYAPVNSSSQLVKTQTLTSFDLQQNQNFSSNLAITLPSATNGTLSCFIYLLTDHSSDYFSTTFYTTQVNELTFSEMQRTYNELVANYTALQSNYNSLFQNYNSLLANYSNLLSEYSSLQNKYDSLSTNYNSSLASHQALLVTYNSQLADFNSLNSNYHTLLDKDNALKTDFDLLNSSRYLIQASYDALNASYTALNQTYNSLESQISNFTKRISDSENALNSDKIVMGIFIAILVCLIALIAYLRKKETNPYLVIRKETVTVKPDQNQ